MNVYEKKSVINRYFIILQRNDRWLWNLLPVYFENLSNVKVYFHRACYRYVKHKEHEKFDASVVS